MKKNRFVVLFFTISSLAIFYNLFFAYDQIGRITKIQTFVAHHQARILKAFVVAFQQTYQKTFLEHHVPIDAKTIHFLPVVSTPEISRKFARLLADKATIRIVSDNPRNPKNLANTLEMRSIEYFKKHPRATEQYRLYRDRGVERFFYASPLYVEKRCLQCHGKRSEAPEYIRTHYDKAYGYKEGDIRGLLAVYLDQESLHESVKSAIYKNIWTMALITFLFLLLFFFLLRRIYSKEIRYTRELESEVTRKTAALQEQSRALEYRLYHDHLTNLPNRNSLINDIGKLQHAALILINIDDFKEINDFYGHRMGDLLLQKLAELLKKLCEGHACRLYRMPSDEFALLLKGDLSAETLRSFLETLVRQIRAHDFSLDDTTIVHLRIAAGASNDGQDLMITADMAMKKAKAEQKDFVIYDDSTDLSERYRKNLQWAETLKRAIEENRVAPYFQPIVSAHNGEIVMYEALMRIVDEKGKVHAPGEFLEIAKKTRYYPQLTRKIADKVFDALSFIPYDISLNISYLDIVNMETMEYLLQKLSTCERRTKIHIEILESEGIERYDEVFECLERLKSKGCHISLDDFGSGYSNFDHILRLDVDMLKIDGSLIQHITTNPGSRIIVETIVDFAKKLGIKTCAEFVTNGEVYETVKKLGVDYLQGYHIGRPISLETLRRSVKGSSRYDDLV